MISGFKIDNVNLRTISIWEMPNHTVLRQHEVLQQNCEKVQMQIEEIHVSINKSIQIPCQRENLFTVDGGETWNCIPFQVLKN